MAKHSLNWNWGFVLKGWLVGWCVIEAWWEAYLQPRSVSLVCASSSCPARNYRELSNPGEAACAIAALCALIHSTWPAPRGLERATAIGGSVAGFKKNGFGGGWGLGGGGGRCEEKWEEAGQRWQTENQTNDQDRWPGKRIERDESRDRCVRRRHGKPNHICWRFWSICKELYEMKMWRERRVQCPHADREWVRVMKVDSEREREQRMEERKKERKISWLVWCLTRLAFGINLEPKKT